MSMILTALLASMAPPVILVSDEAKTEEESKNKVICKRYPPPVGTRLRGRKVCATKQEWRIRDQEDARAVEHIQNARGLESN